MNIYMTRDGDTVDEVAWNYYGTQDNRELEQVMEANPGLADYGPILPAGISIRLPELKKTQAAAAGHKLWD